MIGIFIVAVVASSISFWGGWFLRQKVGQKKLRNASELADQYLEDAKEESENFKREKLLEAKEEIFQAKQQLENENKIQNTKIKEVEDTLASKENDLIKKIDLLTQKEQSISNKEEELNKNEEKLQRQQISLNDLIQEENTRLEQISGLSSEEAKKIQMQNLLQQARDETAEEINEIIDDAKKMAHKESREVIIQALQRSSVAHIVDTTVSLVKLPDDEMKGRIIGREGRNIRAFESSTGVELLIDDTPNTVVLSGFDPIRREVARQSLEKLIYDGRIHPGRIEEVVIKTHEEIGERIFEIGEQVIQDLGLHSMHNELIRMIGKQYFRISYGQNLLQHSKEVAVLAGEMASMLGLEPRIARRAGILHDIGKTAEEYGDSPYYEIGAELAKKYGEDERIQNSILSQSPHFDEKNYTSPIAVLVKIADGVSVSRPGAQKEILDKYMKRMHQLEEIALSFNGVVEAYAIQAGRELKVIVEYTIIDDKKAQITASNIADKIRKEMEFPGQVKIIVIREYRSVDYAK